MPLLIEQNDTTTTLALQGRCNVEDISEALPSLQTALKESSKLRFEFSSTESVDTAIVQLLLSAAKSSDEFLSGDDPFFKTTLERWGLSSSYARL